MTVASKYKLSCDIPSKRKVKWHFPNSQSECTTTKVNYLPLTFPMMATLQQSIKAPNKKKLLQRHPTIFSQNNATQSKQWSFSGKKAWWVTEQCT